MFTGAAPEPVVKILGETKDGVQLQCAVRGASPKPVVQWQNRAGDIVPAEEPQVSERGGRYDIILQTTVTKTDHYRCVSTQEEIHHEIYTETYIIVPGEFLYISASTSSIIYTTHLLRVAGWSQSQLTLGERRGSPVSQTQSWHTETNNHQPFKPTSDLDPAVKHSLMS